MQKLKLMFKSKKAMDLNGLMDVVIGFVIVALIAAAGGIALDKFNDTLTADTHADNITDNGLQGLLNSTTFFSTIGTLAGVSILISIVLTAFYFGRK